MNEVQVHAVAASKYKHTFWKQGAEETSRAADGKMCTDQARQKQATLLSAAGS